MLTCHLCKQQFEGEPMWTNCAMLCQDCYEKPRYRYFYINRPPGIGCQPVGFVDRETWMPTRTHKGVGGNTRHFYGWVEYTEPLEPEQIWKWEFEPRNAWEVNQYWDWREENNR